MIRCGFPGGTLEPPSATSEDDDEPPQPGPGAGGSEAAFIAALQHAGVPLRVPPGDDAAVLEDGTAWTLDTLVEGVHFDHRLSPADVGWKCVAVSVSDLAAMGARPTYLLLGLSMPSGEGFDGFRDGLHEALDTFGLTLIGGDTTRAPIRIITTAAAGTCTHPLTRTGACVGDHIWVTGELGWAGEGWSSPTPSSRALQALRRPHPPFEFGPQLVGRATAAMDLSDGLLHDLPRLCEASAVGAHVVADDIPGHPDLRLRVAGGEDYQLLFTAPPSESFDEATRIGTITSGEVELDVGWPDPLFSHFGASA